MLKGKLNFWGRFFVLTGGRALGALATFLSSLIIANYWGAETLGTLAVYLSALGIFAVVASGGLPSVGSLLAPEYAAKGKLDLLKKLTLGSRKQMLLGSILIGVALYGFMLISRTDDPFTSIYLTAVFMVAIYATATLNFHGAVLIGLERQFSGSLPEALLKPTAFFAIVLVAAISQQSLGAENLLLAFLVGVVLASALSYLKIAKTAYMAGNAAKVGEAARWRATAMPWLMTTLASDLFIEFHILLTGFLAAASEVAVLHVAFRFRVLAAFGMRSIHMLFLPKIIAANASEDSVRVTSNLLKMNSLSLGYSVSILGLFLIAGPYLMGLFGQGFESGTLILIVVSLSIFARALFGPASSILAMHGHHSVTAKITLLMLAASLLGSTLLYPVFGMMGVASAYSVANFITGFALWRLALSRTHIDCSTFAVVKPAVHALTKNF